jgi:CHASE3 domain sensor protein
MKILIAFSLAGLLLAVASATSYAGGGKKNATRTHAAATNQQISIKLLRLRAATVGINQ